MAMPTNIKNGMQWASMALCAMSIFAADEHLALAQDSEAIIGQIRTEAPKKWAEYEEALSGKLRYKCRVAYVDRSTGEKKEAVFSRNEVGAHGMMEWREDFRPGGRASVFVLNERYAFELTKSSGGAGWVATNVQLRREGERDFDYETRVLKGANKRVTAAGPFRASSLWLPAFMKAKGLIISNPKSIDGPSGKLVRFEIGHDHTMEARRRPSKGWVVLDPSQWWRVCESEVHIIYPGSPEYDLAYCSVECELHNGMPILKRVTTRIKSSLKGKFFDQEGTEDYSIDREDSDAADFRLTAFGLPEPVGVHWPKPTRWWLWISLGAVGTAACALLFFKLRKRYQSPDPESAEQGPESAKS
ncbi:MAG: hypothetical protein HYR84_09275 [Planctomycetes bacterium]|nr:hypothetical protein [Planctomycetota bacterium]